MAVGMALEHGCGQGLLAQIFVVVAPQSFADVVECVLAMAREIFLGESWGQDLLGQEISEGRQVVAMNRAFDQHIQTEHSGRDPANGFGLRAATDEEHATYGHAAMG